MVHSNARQPKAASYKFHWLTFYTDMVLIEIQGVGKDAALCTAGSAFQATYEACLSCLEANGEDSSFIIQYIQKFYANSIGFCADSTPIPVDPPGLPTGSSWSSTSSSGCPPYPTATRTRLTSSPTKTGLSTTASTAPSATATTSYPFGFWLEYTFVPCPTRTANPSFTYPAECVPINYSWGCPPGYLCTPPQVDCNLEVGPPVNGYLCSPDDCKIPPYFTGFPQSNETTNSTVYSPLPLPTGFFNLNPVIFGADWGVFTGDVSITSTSRPATSTAASNASTSTIPSPSPAPSQSPVNQNTDKKWIAGPVVGGFAAVVILGLAILYLLRRRRQRKVPDTTETHEKAQLDGTEVKPKEAGGNEIKEIEGRNLQPVEMDAGYAGAEMGPTRTGEDAQVQEIGHERRT
ncbi:hypothetical protein DL98DRAFT_565739 [Cadophora sp. DSE1049]|nr:hypothetical protein DL98DRAFT_565739 [Cadophora sp. DSE1049]